KRPVGKLPSVHAPLRPCYAAPTTGGGPDAISTRALLRPGGDRGDRPRVLAELFRRLGPGALAVPRAWHRRQPVGDHGLRAELDRASPAIAAAPRRRQGEPVPLPLPDRRAGGVHRLVLPVLSRL